MDGYVKKLNSGKGNDKMLTESTVLGRTWEEWEKACPVVADIRALRETGWRNEDKKSCREAIEDCELTMADVLDAGRRLRPEGSSNRLFGRSHG